MKSNSKYQKLIICFFLYLLLIPLSGCSQKDVMVLPLEEGTKYVYTGRYTSRGGSGKPITITSPEHTITVERSFEKDGEIRYLLAFYIGDHRESSFIVTQNQEGVFIVAGSEKKYLVIPRNLRSGQKWEYQAYDRQINVKAGGWKTFDTPMGTLQGREILLSTQDRTRIQLYINNDQGIIGLKYSYITQGANRSEADLYLSKIISPEDH